MRDLDVRCDNCGAEKPKRSATVPAKTWWSLDDIGSLGRSGPLDFCSLPCVQAFIADPQVRKIFEADFVMPAGVAGNVNVPMRYRIVTWCRRLRLSRWVVQMLIVRVS